MLRRRVYSKLLVASMLTSMTLFAGSVFGQSTATRTDNQQKEVANSAPKPLTPDNKVAPATPRRDDLQSEVDALKAENAAVRELLRKMEEQQKALLENVERLPSDRTTVAESRADAGQ